MAAAKKSATKKAAKKPAKRKAVEDRSDDDCQAWMREMVASNPRVRIGYDLVEEVTRVVPSPFPGFNRSVVGTGGKQKGGLPLGATCIVHGPAAGGKTSYLLGAGIGYQLAGGGVAYLDAEGTLHAPWVFDLDIDPSRFMYLGKYPWGSRDESLRKKDMPPLYYEDAIMQVNDWIDGYIKRIHAGMNCGPLLIVVDSLKKLVPRNLAAQMTAKKGNVRSIALGREQASYNTNWVADLGPKICDHDITVVFVQHESEGEVDFRGHMKMKLKGGQGIQYDASMIMRMSYSSAVYDKAQEDGVANVGVGKKHRVTIEKNKIGPHYTGSAAGFDFFVSNGKGICPSGWDRPREFLSEAMRRGLVGGSKWTYKFNPTLGAKFMLGDKRCTLKQLYTNHELMAELEGLLK